MRRALAAVALLVAAYGCRTARPAGEETTIAPLTSTSPNDASRQLAARVTSFTAERALLRIRAANGPQTQSFRAQLIVDGAGRMRLDAFTPIGTTAIELYAAGDEVTFVNDLEQTWWRGPAAEFARSFGFFGSASPSSTALLLTGLPSAATGATYDYAPTGLSRATAGDAVVTFDPPVYPPRHVTIARGAQKLDVEFLESALTTAKVEAPEIPKDYRCCVPPRL